MLRNIEEYLFVKDEYDALENMPPSLLNARLREDNVSLLDYLKEEKVAFRFTEEGKAVKKGIQALGGGNGIQTF